ncbi:MAG: hypothetical protein AB1Z98_23490 [Nannocystaceae bacterium]
MPALAAGLPACDSSDELDELELHERTSEGAMPFEPQAFPHEPSPFEPEPEPEPEPVDAHALVGLTLEEVLAGSPWTVVYEMDAPPSVTHPYGALAIADPDHGWPAHALQWKDYVAGPSYGFDMSAAASAIAGVFGLGYYVSPLDPVSLNAFEGGGVVFSGDPPGDWMQAQFNDPAVGLVYAAMVMHLWGSPVYVDATHNYPVGSGAHGSYSHTIGLQRLEFTLTSAPDLLTACGLPINATPAAALSVVPTCSHGAILTGDRVSLWNDFGCSSCPGANYVPYDADVAMVPGELVTAWWLSLGNQGQLVFDPPAEATEEDLEGLAVLAEALAEQVLVESDDGTLVLMRDYVAELEPLPQEG